MKKIYKIFTFIVLVAMFMCFITSDVSCTVYDPIENPNSYDPSSTVQSSNTDQTALTTKVKPIINAIATIGIVVAVITLVVLGVKYMVGSVEEKAEYKKTMVSYIVGVVFLIATSAILEVINTFVLSAF